MASIGTPSIIKENNKALILEEIRKHGQVTKPQLAAATGLSLVTVNKLTEELESQKDIVFCGYAQSQGGRKPGLYRFNESKGYFISVLARKQKFYYQLQNLSGKLVSEGVAEYADEAPGLVLHEIVDKLLAQVEKRRLLCVAVAVPGTVEEGVISNIPTIPQWEGYDLAGELREKYECAVIVENDIRSVTMGVYHDHAKGGQIKNMVLLYVEEGIGAGIVIDGKLYHSRSGFAGEIGHMNIRSSVGETRRVEQLVLEVLDGGEEETGLRMVAQMVANMACVLEPDLVVLMSNRLEGKAPVIEAVAKEVLDPRYIHKLTTETIDPKAFLIGLFDLCLASTEPLVAQTNKK